MKRRGLEEGGKGGGGGGCGRIEKKKRKWSRHDIREKQTHKQKSLYANKETERKKRKILEQI